ncbi:MAG: hypothetical protein ACI9H6_000191 [Patiriisocius sp.]|jgi:hypothetical protein
MNRALIITIGIVIIILVLAVWVYLMLFGTPKGTGEVFTNLGFELSSQGTTIQTPEPDNILPDVIVDTQTAALRQLTTRPVAGFTFASTTFGQTVRYVERGTGHIYEINLDTGIETPLSRTTVPKVSEAVFSPGGETIALTSYNQYTPEVFVGTLAGDINITGIALQPGADNIVFETDTEIRYSLNNNGTTKGFSHDIETLVQRELFSFNYINLDVSWGSDLDEIYLSTKPAHNHEGFIYTIANNILTPATFSANGLSALITNNYIVTTYNSDGRYASGVVDTRGEFKTLPLLALKEKCVSTPPNNGLVWCAAPLETDSPTFVEDWYKGIRTSADHFWLLDVQSQTARLEASPVDLVGRTIDVSDISINPEGQLLTFTNKIDHTLWLYDTTDSQ